MGLFDWFRRAAPIEERAALAEYLDTRAAFLVQKGIFDYARAISGPYFSSLVREQVFSAAVDVSRWRSYPITLVIVTEMVHGALRPHAPGAVPLAHALQALALDVFDRYPVPAPIGPETWAAARAELDRRLAEIALKPVKQVKDIPLPFADQIFDNLPIHERLRGRDREMVTNHLRANLIRMHEDFTQRANSPALIAALGLGHKSGAREPAA